MPLITNDIITHLKRDPVLARQIDQVKLESADEPVDVFIYLVRSIVSQQLSIQSAASIYNRLIHHEEIDPVNPHSFLAVDIEELRALGLSYQKANYVKNVCQFFVNNEITMSEWLKKSNKEIIELLTGIKGVGVWTVQMVLMFALHRPDIFPEGDLGIQLGMKKLYNLESEKKQLKKDIQKIAESWAPYRTVGSLYIWRYKDAKE